MMQPLSTALQPSYKHHRQRASTLLTTTPLERSISSTLRRSHLMADLLSASTSTAVAGGPPPAPSSNAQILPSNNVLSDPAVHTAPRPKVRSTLTTKSMAAVEPDVLVEKATEYAREYMSQPHHDASHDFAHILRVLRLAKHILAVESATNPTTLYSPLVVTLAALLHDVGDHKYVLRSHITLPGETEDPETVVKRILVGFGAGEELARTVQTVVKNVSYSKEIRDVAHVRGVLLRHPELAIVQDADRLDAIGAVGIGRCFTYGGAKGRPAKGRTEDGRGGMDETVEHFEDKLVKLEGMMKTAEGKRLAGERTERLRMFRDWWDDEVKGRGLIGGA